MQWANEFNAVLTTRGEDLCAIGYEGFLRSGSKGAVAVRFLADVLFVSVPSVKKLT